MITLCMSLPISRDGAVIEEMQVKPTTPNSRPVNSSKLAWWRDPWGIRVSRFLLVIAFSIEAAIFYRTMIVELAPYFPRNFDQTSYYLDPTCGIGPYRIAYLCFRPAFSIFPTHVPRPPIRATASGTNYANRGRRASLSSFQRDRLTLSSHSW